MALTYDRISTTTLSTTSTSITFSSITSAYDDLRLICYFGYDGGANFYLRINGSSTAEYFQQRFWGNSVTRSSNQKTTDQYFLTDQSMVLSPFFNFAIVDFYNYKASTKKNIRAIVGGASSTSNYAFIEHDTNVWNNSAAISSIEFGNLSVSPPANMVAGSRATLYGIVRA